MQLELEPVWLSIKVSIIAVAMVLVLGTCLATLMLHTKFPGRNILESLILLPMVLPPSVLGFLLLLVFGKFGPVGKFLDYFGIHVLFSWIAAIIASTVVSLPIMYQSVKSALESVDPNLEQAARILGAGELKVLRTITFPLAWSGFISGIVLSFARALGEFGATLMIAGNIPGKTQTIPLAIYFASQSSDMTKAGILVSIMVVISFLSIFGLSLWRKKAVVWR